MFTSMEPEDAMQDEFVKIRSSIELVLAVQMVPSVFLTNVSKPPPCELVPRSNLEISYS